MIPDEVISQIRDAADIVAVIGQHVQLKKAGRNWKGLCPFHGEKTPSFNVNAEKGFFHCFGCAKHGDIFTFVMELEGKSFVEAAEQLAGRFGIAVPRIEESPELRRARGERAAMLDLNKVATAFYREVLADPTRGEPGRAYLAKRGVTAETAEKFQLGYATADWGLLADHLKEKRCDLELAVKLGLLAHRPRAGGYYDRNRDRLVCPVVLPGGEIAGFSSRVVGVPPEGADASDAPPKYINSPESAIYKKGSLLFGLAQARDAMASAKRAVLVEGNFDVITLHQAGFCEVVAPLGTALTPEQVNKLKRLTERVILLYDGDRAGYKATMHSLQLCMEAEFEAKVAARPGHARSGGAGTLADGMDPDSLVASGGAALLREAVDRAQGGIEFFAFEVWGKAARGNADARTRAIDEAARLVTKVASPTKRDLIVGTLATAMDVDVAVVRNAITRVSGQGSSQGGSYGGQNGYGSQGGSQGGGSYGSRGSSQNNNSYNSRGSQQGGSYGSRGSQQGGSYGSRGSQGSAGSSGSHPNAPGRGDGRSDNRPDPRNSYDARDERSDPRDSYDPRDSEVSGSPGGPSRAQVAPPSEEVELISLFADHPSLMATSEADKAFWLLTDERLQAMYSAAQREGRSLAELAPVHLPPSTAMLVLSGKYTEHKDPRAALLGMIGNFEARKRSIANPGRLSVELEDTSRQMREAQRRGERELARLFAQLAMAQRSGDREQIARITDEISSNRKQVD